LLAPRPRLCVLLVAQHEGKFVVLRRAVQPFLGIAEWPAGAVHLGESREDAAARITKDRLGCVAEATWVGMFRRIDLFENGVFDDKLFAVHTVALPEDAP